MNYTTRLTQNGQMTLPKRIRDLLQAKAGTQLKVTWENDRAVIGVLDTHKRLQQARHDSITHLKKHGLYGLTDKQVAEGITEQKIEYYGKKYGIS